MSNRLLASLLNELSQINISYIKYSLFQQKDRIDKDNNTFFVSAVLNNQTKIFIKFLRNSDNLITQEIKNLVKFQENNQVVRFLGITSYSSCSQGNNSDSVVSEEKVDDRNQNQDDLWIGIVLEHSTYGSVSQYLEKNPQTTFERRLNWCIQLCQVINHLHEKNYIHRDIKPDNVLLFEGDQIKLCDFGLTQKRLEELTTMYYCGTPEFSAPETYCKQINDNYNNDNQKGRHTFGSDIYSLGLTVVNILTGYSPNRNGSKSNYISDCLEKAREIILPCYQKEMKDLFLSCIDDSPTKRISISEIKNKLTIIEQKEKFRVFKEQNQIRNTVEVDLFSHLIQKNSFLVFNFFDISFTPKQNNVEYLEYVCELQDIKLIDYFMKQPNVHDLISKDLERFAKIIIKCFQTAYDQSKFDLIEYWEQSTVWEYFGSQPLNKNQENICMLACSEGYHIVLKYFIEKQKNYLKEMIPMPNKRGENMLMLACENNHNNMVQSLVENCVSWLPSNDLHAQRNDGDNLLMSACYHQNIDLVKYLIENETSPFTDIHAINKNQQNVLMIACDQQRIDIVTYLLDNPNCCFTQIHQKTMHDYNALMIACLNNNLPMIQYLLENKTCPFTDIHASNKDGDNVLMLACTHNHLDIIQYLIENKTCPFTDIHAIDKDGNNAFMIACLKGYLHIVKYLIENKICPFTQLHVTNKSIQTALSLATNQEIRLYLQKILK